MKIYTACSTGLGSSFMTQLNIQKALGELGVEGVETDHTDIASVTENTCDVLFVGVISPKPLKARVMWLCSTALSIWTKSRRRLLTRSNVTVLQFRTSKTNISDFTSLIP